jgi:sarcosine oxidase subunit beta
MMGFMLKARERGVKLRLDTQVTGIEVEPCSETTSLECGGSTRLSAPNRFDAALGPSAGSANHSPATSTADRLKPALLPAPSRHLEAGAVRRISGVHTIRGFISTRIVVNAAGPWAAQVAEMAGAQLPVEPLRRQLVPTEPFDQLPQRFPMVIDMSTGFHFRREGKGILLAWNDPDETPGFKTDFDPGFVEKILTRAASRVPCLAEAEVNPRRAWAGLYEMTPDHHAIIGPAPNVQGLYFVNGFSGHGVMHSPASGRITADLILHGHSDLIDATQLGVQRFSDGRFLQETAVL